MVAFRCYSSFDQTVSGQQNTAFFFFSSWWNFFIPRQISILDCWRSDQSTASKWRVKRCICVAFPGGTCVTCVISLECNRWLKPFGCLCILEKFIVSCQKTTKIEDCNIFLAYVPGSVGCIQRSSLCGFQILSLEQSQELFSVNFGYPFDYPCRSELSSVLVLDEKHQPRFQGLSSPLPKETWVWIGEWLSSFTRTHNSLGKQYNRRRMNSQ